jgi:hypothetical protein
VSFCPSVLLSECPSVRVSFCPSVILFDCPCVQLSNSPFCPTVRLQSVSKEDWKFERKDWKQNFLPLIGRAIIFNVFFTFVIHYLFTLSRHAFVSPKQK